MHEQVTEDMVTAALGHLPGVWNRARVRRALTAALALIPDGDEIDVPLTLNIHFLLDEGQMRSAVADAVGAGRAALPLDTAGMLDLATLRTPIATPHPAPTLELGTPADIARRLDVARSTVSGWIKNRTRNHMPEPADGDVYDLAAIEAWHRTRKRVDSTIGVNNGRR